MRGWVVRVKWWGVRVRGVVDSQRGGEISDAQEHTLAAEHWEG